MKLRPRSGYKADIACGVRVMNDWFLQAILEGKTLEDLFNEKGPKWIEGRVQ